MVLPLAPLIGGALGLAGTLFQNSAASANAERQMKFQKEMDNTKYQRGMADMKAAGLNPMLAYSQGGAGSPAGASAPVANVGESVARAAEGVTNSAKTSSLIRSQVENMDADTRLKIDQSKAAVENAKLASANSAVTLGTMPYLIDKANFDSVTAEGNMMINGALVKRSGIEKEYLSSDVGKTLAAAALAGSDANAASSALKNLNPGDWIGKTFKALGQ